MKFLLRVGLSPIEEGKVAAHWITENSSACPRLELVQSQQARGRNRTIFQSNHKIIRELYVRIAVELAEKPVGTPVGIIRSY